MGCFKEILIEQNSSERDLSFAELEMELEILDQEVDALDLRCREFERDIYSLLLPTFETRYGFMKSHYSSLVELGPSAQRNQDL